MVSVVNWTDVVTAVATTGAALGTLATLVIFGLQLRVQARAIEEQRVATAQTVTGLTEQLQLQRSRAETESSIAELTFNLKLTTTLNESLRNVAADRATAQYMWGSTLEDGGSYSRDAVNASALLDVFASAFGAVATLRSFARNEPDWIQYFLDTLCASDNLLTLATSREGRAYWPELYPMALALSSSGIITAAEYLRRRHEWESQTA